jgi:hypothetical protein
MQEVTGSSPVSPTFGSVAELVAKARGTMLLTWVTGVRVPPGPLKTFINDYSKNILK